ERVDIPFGPGHRARRDLEHGDVSRAIDVTGGARLDLGIPGTVEERRDVANLKVQSVDEKQIPLPALDHVAWVREENAGILGPREDFKMTVNAVGIISVQEGRTIVVILNPDLAELARIVGQIDGRPFATIPKGVVHGVIARAGRAEGILLTVGMIQTEAQDP